MGQAGRPPVLAVAVRWPAAQSESWREARGPARGRPAYGVDASFTLLLRHG